MDGSRFSKHKLYCLSHLTAYKLLIQIPNPADRSGLVDDAFNLARGGYLSYDVALEMTKYLNQDMHHLPWDSAYSEIIYLSRMFENSGKFDSLSVSF